MTGSRIFATATPCCPLRCCVRCEGEDLQFAKRRACAPSTVTVSPAAYSAARVFRPKAPESHQITRAYRQTVTAAAAAPQLKEINYSEIANKVKRQLLINGKFVDAIGGELIQI